MILIWGGLGKKIRVPDGIINIDIIGIINIDIIDIIDINIDINNSNNIYFLLLLLLLIIFINEITIETSC